MEVEVSRPLSATRPFAAGKSRSTGIVPLLLLIQLLFCVVGRIFAAPAVFSWPTARESG